MQVLQLLSELLLDPAVMWSEYEELMAGPGSKLPTSPRAGLEGLFEHKTLFTSSSTGNGFGARILAILHKYEDSQDSAGREAFRAGAQAMLSCR